MTQKYFSSLEAVKLINKNGLEYSLELYSLH